MVFVHDYFKEELKNLRPDLQTKFELKDIDTIPNEKIIQRLQKAFNDENYLRQKRLVNDTGNDFFVSLILQQVKSIDDQFIWTENWLFRWTWLTEMLNDCEQESTEAELFKVWKICRVAAIEKLRNLALNTTMSQYVGKHFEIIGYSTDLLLPNTISIGQGNNGLRDRYKRVYCKDWFGLDFSIPQVALVPTSIKDLKWHEEKLQLEKIVAQLQDSSKYEIAEVTTKYQTTLRDFMEQSTLLEEKLCKDYVTEAKKILEIQLHTKEILEKNAQITNVNYLMGKSLIVETVPLFIENTPIGRFRMEINLIEWRLRIYNIDINNTSVYQHPHIQYGGECCLGDRVNPLRESYSKKDYVTLVWWIISYLEHINPRSVFINMESFQESHYKLFKYSLEWRQAVKTEESITLDPETPTLVIADEAVNIPSQATLDQLLTEVEETIRITDAQPGSPVWNYRGRHETPQVISDRIDAEIDADIDNAERENF